MNLIRHAADLSTRSMDLGLGGRGAHLAIPSLLGPVLASFLVFNRVYWRIAIVHTLGLDDMCIMLSLVFLFAHCMVNLVAVDHGYGRPTASLSTPDLHMALKMFYLDQIFYKITINLTKLSILCLYLRIFSQTWFRRTCWSLLVLISSYAVCSIIATIFQCTPIPRFWNKKLPGTCINVTAFWYANAIFNIVTDVIILGSVPPVIWKLRLPRRQKWGLTVVFGLGGFVFATSILRMTTLDVASKAPDPTFGTLKSTMWTTIEASTAIVCACLPMVRTPIQRLVPKLFPSHYGTSSRTSKKAGAEAHPVNVVPAKPVFAAAGNVGNEAARPTTTESNSATLIANGGQDLEMGSANEWPKRLSSARSHRRILSLSSEQSASPTKYDTWG